MKRAAIVLNAAGLALLLGLLLYALVLGNLKVAMILTQMDRAECFNEAKVVTYFRGEFQGIRSHEAAAHISGPWIGLFHVALILGACVCSANLLVHLRAGSGPKRQP